MITGTVAVARLVKGADRMPHRVVRFHHCHRTLHGGGKALYEFTDDDRAEWADVLAQARANGDSFAALSISVGNGVFITLQKSLTGDPSPAGPGE